MALILASCLENFQIKAVTTVFGNSTIEKTSNNALKILELIDLYPIPIARGSSEPIVKNLRFAEYEYLNEVISLSSLHYHYNV